MDWITSLHAGAGRDRVGGVSCSELNHGQEQHEATCWTVGWLGSEGGSKGVRSIC